MGNAYNNTQLIKDLLVLMHGKREIGSQVSKKFLFSFISKTLRVGESATRGYVSSLINDGFIERTGRGFKVNVMKR